MGKRAKAKQIVRLREKKLSNGYVRLYLDINHNGSRWTEFLTDLKYKEKPRTTEERLERSEVLSLGEQIRANKESMIIHSNYGKVSPRLRSKDFIDYFQKFLDEYPNKDKRIVKYCLTHFKKFLQKDHLSFGSLNDKLLKNFKAYLDKELNGETPYNYFAKLKRIVKSAYKDGYLSSNPAENIQNNRNDGVKKSIITIDEFKSLSKTKCKNEQVRNAFLFCFNTGLRFCDVQKLTWSNIQSSMLVLKAQEKTKKPVTVHLNSNAFQYLGERGKNKELVFQLPSFTSCLKILKDWAVEAGITNNITWHSARHSLATYLVSEGHPINIVGGILGHTTIKHTQKYIRYVDELGKKAINSIPLINEDNTSRLSNM